MKQTGITLIDVAGDRTPRTVGGDRMSVEVGMMHGSVYVTGPHARTFLTPTGQNVTVWWSQSRTSGAVQELFIDTRGYNSPDPSLTDRRKADH